MPTFQIYKGGKKVGELVGANPGALEVSECPVLSPIHLTRLSPFPRTSSRLTLLSETKMPTSEIT